MVRIVFAIPLILIVLVNGWIGHFNHDRFFEELPKAYASHYAGAQVGGTRDLLLVSCGLRALASDFAMLDMLIYYGSHELEKGHDHLRKPTTGDTGVYLDLYPLTRRIMALDPFFRYAILYGSGALAFNEGREEQSIEILEEAMKKDIKHWRYSLIIASIAYKKAQNYLRIVRSLEPLAETPDCPTMFKNILGNYYMKLGKIYKAILLFQKIAETASEPEYREMARLKLERLKARK